MLQKLEQDITSIIVQKYPSSKEIVSEKLIIELPPEKIIDQFDVSTNIALILGKVLQLQPIEIANNILEQLKKIPYIDKCEILQPAFINISIKDNILLEMINNINKNGDKNLIKNLGNNEKINIEFCSANPTGPLHIGHARGIVFGDTLANLLEKSGYDVCREYYINDAGGQMDKLEKSIQWRISGCKGTIPEDCYPGEYLQIIVDKRKQELLTNKNKIWSKTETANDMITNFIKPTLTKMKIKYQKWSSEQELKDNNIIDESIKHLKKLGLIYTGILKPPKGKYIEDYEPREQLLFKSSQFGDDVDRPLAKSDGSHTYFASDIAYHYDKWKRGFNNMVVVLGADHKGYVKRLTSAVKAISNNKGDVHIKLCELVNFMKNGQLIKMSKRKNNFLTINDVLEDIDVNILRFIILTRKADTVLNFDLEKAKEQSKDNSIWYIQYAYARCQSVLNKAQEQNITLSPNIDTSINLSHNFHKMIIKIMFYTRFLELAVKSYEPYFFANYLIQLANEFHGLYEKEKFIETDNIKASLCKLSVVKSIQYIIKNGLNACGVDIVEHM